MQDQDNNNILTSLAGMSLMASDEKHESHPDSETIASLVDESLSEQQQIDLKKHVVSCEKCYQQWFVLKNQMLAFEQSQKPWYSKLFELDFKLNPLPINLASGAVAASLIFVLVNQLMPDLIPDNSDSFDVPKNTLITFNLPTKLQALQDFCKDCSQTDYQSFSEDLIKQLKENCQTDPSTYTQQIQQQLNSFVAMHHTENQKALMEAINLCESEIL